MFYAHKYVYGERAEFSKILRFSQSRGIISRQATNISTIIISHYVYTPGVIVFVCVCVCTSAKRVLIFPARPEHNARGARQADGSQRRRMRHS